MHKQFAAQIGALLKLDVCARRLACTHDNVDLDLALCRSVAGAIRGSFSYPIEVLESGSSFVIEIGDTAVYRTTSSKQLFNVLDAMVRELLGD